MNNTTENQITVISEMQIKSFMNNYILYNDLPPRGKFIASMEDGKTACLDTTFYPTGKPVYNLWTIPDLALDWLKYQTLFKLKWQQ